MPRKIFKRSLPSLQTIQKNPFIKLFGKYLQNPNLWLLTRYSISMAFSIGVFTFFIPLPLHTPIGIVLALWFHANLPICFAIIWLNTPVTYLPIFYFAFRVGSFILNSPAIPFTFTFSMEWLNTQCCLIWKPLLLGCTLCAFTFAILANILLRLFWRCAISFEWNKRNKKRLNHAN